jgi:hypothetical protein
MKFTQFAVAGALALFLGQALFAFDDAKLSGVWKADMEKSKFEGRPPHSELMIIEQTPSALTQTIGEFSQRGEYRSRLTYKTDGTESKNSFRGLPMKSTAKVTGETLTIESHVAGVHPAIIHQTFTLSPDGKTLQMDGSMSMNGKDNKETIVFEKQPEAAGEPLRKPEETAGQHYKNVKLLKDLPASHFIDTMRYFTASLGVDCEHCHVKGHFDADDKKEKKTARTMITMVHDLDQNVFNGHQEVRCYTCHRGNEEPKSQIPFE